MAELKTRTKKKQTKGKGKKKGNKKLTANLQNILNVYLTGRKQKTKRQVNGVTFKNPSPLQLTNHIVDQIHKHSSLGPAGAHQTVGAVMPSQINATAVNRVPTTRAGIQELTSSRETQTEDVGSPRISLPSPPQPKSTYTFGSEEEDTEHQRASVGQTHASESKAAEFSPFNFNRHARVIANRLDSQIAAGDEPKTMPQLLARLTSDQRKQLGVDGMTTSLEVGKQLRKLGYAHKTNDFRNVMGELREPRQFK